MKEIIKVKGYEITVINKNNGYEEYFIKLNNIWKMMFVLVVIKSVKYKKQLCEQWIKDNENIIKLMI